MTILGPDGQPIKPVSSGGHRTPRRLGWMPPTQEVSSQVDISSVRGQHLQGRYDATYITRDNELHWANADNLSPNRANSYTVRRRLRARSRYEAVENNSILKGIVLTLANDFVGGGPRPVCVDPRLSESARKAFSSVFELYCRAINLRGLLWRLRHAKCVDGESFAIQYTDTTLPPGIPMVNWYIVEAEQCTTEWRDPETQYQVDGIKFDRYGRPREYFFLYHHPNENYLWSQSAGGPGAYDGRWIRDNYVVHWFRQERPWQRGIPETTPALPLCAYLRRYNLAVLAAAETAANMAGVVKSAASPYPSGTSFGPQPSGAPDCSYEAFDSFEMERGMWTMLPEGYDTYQFKAEQPTQTHEKFVDTVLREIARCMQVPFNLAVGHSGGYNFASGTLDRQLYNAAIKREREHAEYSPLAAITRSWFREAIRIPGYLPQEIANMEFMDPPLIDWSWGVEPEHADPSKVTESLIALWEKGLLTDEEILSTRFNMDPEAHYESLKRSIERRKELGVSVPGAGVAPNLNNEPSPETTDENESTGTRG